MTINVPTFFKECTNERLLVLTWFVLHIGRQWPETREKKKLQYMDMKGKVKSSTETWIKFGFYPEDIRTIIRSSVEPNKLIEAAGINEHLMITELSGQDTLVQMRSSQDSYEYELKDQHLIELVCYLSGCLNGNLIREGLPTKYYMIDRAVRKRFNWHPKWGEGEALTND